MKKLVILFLAVFAQSTITLCQTGQKEFPVLKGPYLGQKPPGKTPVMFAPGIVSRDDIFEHSAAIFSPNNSEVYWSGKPFGTRYFKIYFMKTVDGKWTEPKIAYSHKEYSFGNPVISSDGNRLFFDSRGDIWFVERTGDDWTEAVQISPLINSDGSETLRSITENGSVYFSRYNKNASSEGRLHEIYVSRKIDGNYTEPEKLDKNINSDDAKEFGAYVAPDESYMIFEAANDSRIGNLFISYKGKNNLWSERIKLSLGNARFPAVSPDGKYLFFMTHDGLYWVKASFIEELKPKELK